VIHPQSIKVKLDTCCREILEKQCASARENRSRARADSVARTASPGENLNNQIAKHLRPVPAKAAPRETLGPDIPFVRTFYCHSQYLGTKIFQDFEPQASARGVLTPKTPVADARGSVLRRTTSTQQSTSVSARPGKGDLLILVFDGTFPAVLNCPDAADCTSVAGELVLSRSQPGERAGRERVDEAYLLDWRMAANERELKHRNLFLPSKVQFRFSLRAALVLLAIAPLLLAMTYR
jgi:hypothetical protein